MTKWETDKLQQLVSDWQAEAARLEGTKGKVDFYLAYGFKEAAAQLRKSIHVIHLAGIRRREAERRIDIEQQNNSGKGKV